MLNGLGHRSLKPVGDCERQRGSAQQNRQKERSRPVDPAVYAFQVRFQIDGADGLPVQDDLPEHFETVGFKPSYVGPEAGNRWIPGVAAIIAGEGSAVR